VPPLGEDGTICARRHRRASPIASRLDRGTLRRVDPSPPSSAAAEPGEVEVRYRQRLIDLYEKLTFRGISRTGKAISLPLEDVYVDLQAVTDVPDAAGAPGAEECRLLEEVVADPSRPGVVVLGDPGSGKTTLLHYLALRAARGRERLPIFVPLAAYDDWLRRGTEAMPLRDFLSIY
jgi:hypothetical protein